MKIEGKVSLVTGGSSGIGKALILRLLERGAKFVAFLDCDETSAQKTLSELSLKFAAERVKFIRCDVTDEQQLKKSFREAYEVHDALDIVINNAGIMYKDNVRTINVNLIPVMNGMMIANELMTKRKRTEKGVIVNTASVTGFEARPYLAMGYVASKHGVVGLTKSFQCSSDRFSDDLRAVAICPDGVDTEIMTRNDFLTEEISAMLGELNLEEVIARMSSVIDAFIVAIEDDTLSGACIEVKPSGTTVIR